MRWLWLNANYRSYDLNNKTPPFQYDQKVSYDTTLVNTPGESSHPYSFNRSTLELDASFTPFRNGAFKLGYVREDDRSHAPHLRHHGGELVAAGYDWTSNPFVTVRAGYLRQERRGKGFHPEILEQYSEQPGMRHADISNRDRDAAQFVVTFLPTADLSVNFNGAVGNDDRPDVEFGLRSQDWDSVGFGVDYSPSDKYNLGASYLYEAFGSFEASRTASPPPDPTFTDARRNWNDDIEEKVHTFNLYFEVPKIAGKFDFGVQYDYTKAETSWLYGVAPGQHAYAARTAAECVQRLGPGPRQRGLLAATQPLARPDVHVRPVRRQRLGTRVADAGSPRAEQHVPADELRLGAVHGPHRRGSRRRISGRIESDACVARAWPYPARRA